MDFLPLEKLGAREVSPKVIDFGILLPGVDGGKGFQVSVKIIHENDQYLQAVQPVEVPLAHSADPTYGDYWSKSVDLAEFPATSRPPSWGQEGRYVYRYVVRPPGGEPIDFIIDPIARESGVGDLSAITVGFVPHPFSDHETQWKTPPAQDLIAYELMIAEFGADLDGTIALLPYLADLGVNCIEVMPVSNVANTIDWGYSPLGHFGVDERFGNRRDFQRLVDEAHKKGIAVVIDAVYGHTDDDFPYARLYNRLKGVVPNPFIGPFAKDEFGQSTDFGKKLTQDYYFSANRFWLETFHVDGFRYDDVPEYYDGPLGAGYANLAFSTYRFVKGKEGATDHFQRFFDAAAKGAVRLIQIAEFLPDPPQILRDTYSTGTWQNGTLQAAKDCAAGSDGAIDRLGLQLGLVGYPALKTSDGDVIEQAALQYIENHDHERFICNFGTHLRDAAHDTDVLREGDRDAKWFKVQPYLIALLAAKGVPLLWEGQELCEDYFVPEQGFGRILLFRPVRWSEFYDDIGRTIVRLVRRMTRIRRDGAQFRRGEHFFHNDFARYQSQGLLLFSRKLGDTFSLVAVNFTDQDKQTTFRFPIGGDYEEQIEGRQKLSGVVAGADQAITVPSNYGCIWTIG